ncbi:MAG: TadE family type IV pilus minor pilin [Micromonosporaceae bacterium]
MVRRRSAARRDRGSVTIELAVGLPALVLLLLGALTAVSAVVTKLECVDAAREAVRAEARGEPGVAAGRRVAPDNAKVTMSRHGDTVRARVSTLVRPLGPHLPGIEVAAVAVAEREPGAT